MRSILIVCVGNICRSPMAEALLRERLGNRNVSSAGLSAVIGHGADPHAVALMGERGIDISEHRARQLVDPVSRNADLILVMETSHSREIEQRHPYARGRVFRLGHFDDADIADPYRQERGAFESSLRLIEKGVDQWAQRIGKLF
jgi:protein-tyrosine phosphatase